jgi:hypothetical protein
MAKKTTVLLEFHTDKSLTKEEVEQLHVHVYWQMMLNRQKTGDFLIGSKFAILNGRRKPVVLFDKIGKAYQPRRGRNYRV